MVKFNGKHEITIKVVQPGPRLQHLVRYFWAVQVCVPAQMQSGIRTFVDDSSGIIIQHGDGPGSLIKDGSAGMAGFK